MSVAEEIYEIVKTLPEVQANEILHLAKLLQSKRSIEEKPLDFRNTAGLGQEIWRSIDVEAYLERERASWD